VGTARHRVFGGLNELQEHIFHWIGVVVVLLYVTAWIGALHDVYGIHRQAVAEAKVTHVPPPPAPIAPTQQITAALTGNAPSTAYITDAMLGFLNPLRGASGKVLFTTRVPGAPITDTHGNLTAVLNNGQATDISPEFVAPSQPGVYDLAVKLGQATKQINDFSVVSLVPFSEKQNGHIGLYYLGNWPFEHGGKMKSAAYANPAGFIEVTPQNADTPVSAHFKLRDFLTKDQYNVWPKYILLNPKLLDKLELTIAELERTGHPVGNMHIMSGFRTPEYNYTGGNTQGRANLSRHMYGDASDVFIDHDGNGAEDDLNHDGRIDIGDAMVVQQAVERVEHDHPELVGGVGVYPACCGHGPFTHIDVRGYRARWRGTTGG